MGGSLARQTATVRSARGHAGCCCGRSHATDAAPTRSTWRPASDLERWRKRDPIDRIQKYLAERGQWDTQQAATWETEIAAQVEAAFDKVDTLPPPTAADIYEHVYAEMPPTLARQRAAQLGAD